MLLVDIGHDLRAVRILVGRQTAHLVHHPHDAGAHPARAPAPPVASGTERAGAHAEGPRG
jgi:hypothetical protein